ncbi:MAG: DUF1592 domain-containing protein, partial [Myxococcota bacterium]
MYRSHGLLLLAGLAGACTGQIDDAAPWTPPPDIEFAEQSVDFACSSDVGIDAPLRRLSQSQLNNTLNDLLDELFGPEAAAVRDEVSSAAAGIPSDQRLGAAQDGQLLFFRSDQAVGSGAVEAHYAIGLALGQSLSQPERLVAMGFECATNADPADDAACLDRFVRELGDLTHRRTLADEEFAFYRTEAYDGGDVVDPIALADLVVALVVQPNFVFHVEGVGGLTPREAANRLSYHLWDTMPDAQLRADADSGRLLTDEGWSDAIDRMLADDRVYRSVRPFLLEWFRFDQLYAASEGRGADFDAIAGDLELDRSFDQAVEEEIADLFVHTLRSGGTFRDFFL